MYWPVSTRKRINVRDSWACIQYRERNGQQGISLFCQICPESIQGSFHQFPPLERLDQWAEIKQSFEERHGIPQIVGAIDGTHIPMTIPVHDNLKGYINWKSWASIVFQCVVDGKGNFCNVYGGGPGSMHNTRVFNCSHLGRSLRANSTTPPMIPHGTFLPSVVIPANQWFNFIQSSTRIVVDQAFGRLKKGFENKYFACMILHNILKRKGTLYLHDLDTCLDKEVIFVDLPL
ncbi:hypothetical protein VP01_1443g3 [Puccinia sorghi]|uniref:DDE Tnp4 domain-containing protein n=1 Tax=Puccinia sorghi TaxID=27349 RepID=A0A0L6VM19_9BASI|nr:hypothetical protein VP01_1443g3 [Puccinia sorghi]